MYLIKDQEGRYVSELSFQVDVKKGKEVKYISCTGRCNGMRYYNDITKAEKVLKHLQKINRIYKTNYKFEIADIEIEMIPFGKMIIN